MASEQRYLEPHEQGRSWSWSTGPGEASGAREEPFELPDDDEVGVYVISVAADLAGLHPQTLRAYEREGLITPSRTEGGTRRYSRRDIERLRFIRTLTQDQGLNLAGVRVVLELGEKLEGARRRIGELEEMVRVLAERVEEQGSGGESYQLVRSSPSQVEVHPWRRRMGQRSAHGRASPSAERARPVAPPEKRPADV